MNWLMAQASKVLTCGRCAVPISAGEPYAEVTSAHLPRCQTCMKSQFDAEPPATLWQAQPPTDVVPAVVREVVWPKTIGARLVRDGKLAQLTEHDQ
jgi:hypothetical protein